MLGKKVFLPFFHVFPKPFLILLVKYSSPFSAAFFAITSITAFHRLVEVEFRKEFYLVASGAFLLGQFYLSEYPGGKEHEKLPTIELSVMPIALLRITGRAYDLDICQRVVSVFAQGKNMIKGLNSSFCESFLANGAPKTFLEQQLDLLGVKVIYLGIQDGGSSFGLSFFYSCLSGRGFMIPSNPFGYLFFVGKAILFSTLLAQSCKTIFPCSVFPKFCPES